MSTSPPNLNRTQLEVDAAIASGEHFLSHTLHKTVDVPGVELAIELPVTPRVVNHGGGLQGGMIATLIDLVAGKLAMNGLDPAVEISATNVMNIHFLAPIVEGPARGEGRVLRRGKRSVVVYVEVRDLAKDQLAAVSTVSFTIVPLPSD
jgi:uncharacterized protein (TIGR00369 family)